MNDEDERSNVLPFPVRDDDLAALAGYTREPGPRCRHPAIKVIEKERRCICQKCGAVLDPFDYLLGLAVERSQLAGHVQSLRDEERYRRANVQKLIQLEKNIKARIRRASMKE